MKIKKKKKKKEHWSGLPCPPPGDLPEPGIERMSPGLRGGFFTTSTTREAQINSRHSEDIVSNGSKHPETIQDWRGGEVWFLARR